MIYDKVENMSLYFDKLNGFEKVEEAYKEFCKAPFENGKIEIDGEKIITASNVALVDNTYTLGITDEYMDLLEKALAKEDNLYYI